MDDQQPFRNERGGASRPPLLRLSDRLNQISEVVLFVMMIAMIALTTIQIFFRVFLTALIWTEEVTTYLLVAASLLGAAVAFKRGSHIAVTFLPDKLPSSGRKFMALLVQSVGILFFVIVVVFGVSLMKSEAMQSTPATRISMSWLYLMYPVIGGITLVHLFAGIGTILRGE